MPPFSLDALALATLDYLRSHPTVDGMLLITAAIVVARLLVRAQERRMEWREEADMRRAAMARVRLEHAARMLTSDPDRSARVFRAVKGGKGKGQ